MQGTYSTRQLHECIHCRPTSTVQYSFLLYLLLTAQLLNHATEYIQVLAVIKTLVDINTLIRKVKIPFF